jgi:hypothetical protein
MKSATDISYRCISYPEFEPDHSWLRKMLLFVDEIHRIVPADYALEDSDELKRLMEHCKGCVQICRPRRYIEISEEQGTLFGRALDQPTFYNIAKEKKLKILISKGAEATVENWELLHVEKIGFVVRRELEQRDMIRPSPWHDYWKLVPRGVGGLVVGMLADQAADKLGFDAVTDQPLAFALNSLSQCRDRKSALIEGIIASTLASVHVPKDIGFLPVNEYAELRKRHTAARVEYAKFVREMKDIQRMDRAISPEEFRSRLDDIVEHVGTEMKKFRRSKAASKINDWVPFILTSLVPTAAAYAFGPLPAAITGVFTFTITAVGKLTKPKDQFSYPKVLQAFCAANDAAANAAIRALMAGDVA